MEHFHALNGLGSRIAIERLSQAVEDLLPNAQREAFTQPAVVAEACKRLDLKTIESDTDRVRVLKVLEDAILEYGRSEFDLTSAKERLGIRGTLPLSNYRIAFSDVWRDSFSELSLDVDDAINRADRVQHLRPFSPEGSAEAPFDALSLFVRSHLNDRAPHYLLTVALRKGSELAVAEAWYAFAQHVDCRAVESPVDLLQRFVAVYGCSFSLGPRRNVKFLQNDAFLLPSRPTSLLDLPGTHDAHVSIFARPSPLGMLQVELGYAIDISLYRSHLRELGFLWTR